MTRRRADHEPAFVLHTYPYKETSLVVEAFTRREGRVALLARGARRPRSALRGMLLSFHALRLSWSGSAELATLHGAEWGGAAGPVGGLGLMCGFYINELLLRLVPRADPHEGLFDAYAESLHALAEAGTHDAVLRSFEKKLLAELGYAPVLDRDAASGKPIDERQSYVYSSERGPVASNGARAGELRVSGRTLLDLANDDYSRQETLAEARVLLRALLAERLGSQVLHTRTVLRELHDL